MAKTVLITGASSGFGKETARLFQSKGWNVIATMRSPEAETELSGLKNVLVLRLDVTDKQSIEYAVTAGIEKFGGIDVLVNSAGYGLMGVFESTSGEQMRQQYAVNVFGLMEVTQAVLPVMRKSKKGTIINISTFGGVTAGQFSSSYNSSKFAVEGFSEALSHELAFLNISVKIVEPGSVSTNFRNGMIMVENKIKDYNSELSTFIPRFSKRTQHLKKTGSEEVAQTIYEAATDGALKLRYVVGEDAQFYVNLKYKNNEQNFLNIMRN